jgi:ACT domain-containing protein
MAGHPTLKDAGLDKEHLRTYRKFVNSWARRAKQRSQTIELLIDEIAGILAEKVAFLSDSNPASSQSA